MTQILTMTLVIRVIAIVRRPNCRRVRLTIPIQITKKRGPRCRRKCSARVREPVQHPAVYAVNPLQPMRNRIAATNTTANWIVIGPCHLTATVLPPPQVMILISCP
uniref:Uncharacterized protein n=1 Tax=Cacopsylla melanoneura TaxID=428564 RepID=A0A8D8R6W8_9HEMI